MKIALPAGLVDLAFPQPCLLCGDSLLMNRADPPLSRLPLCGECLRSLEPIRGRRCRVCSLPLISESEVCMRCRTSEFPFVSHQAIYSYSGAVRELITHYKFQSQRILADLFAARLAELLATAFPAYPLVPVPSRPKAVRKRGWDHVGLLAERLRKSYGVRVVSLLRRDNGRSQKTLDYRHRLTNLQGRIHWAHGRRSSKPPRRVVLLDDVFTTGATASECTRILLDHGVGEVKIVTLAVD